ncbi:hypothetical protein OG21DRAFT_1512202 [Imleria badia]|nr:hypothetical protein OG21DRAFT_1512202 [Imleria badia]
MTPSHIIGPPCSYNDTLLLIRLIYTLNGVPAAQTAPPGFYWLTRTSISGPRPQMTHPCPPKLSRTLDDFARAPTCPLAPQTVHMHLK